MLLIHDHDFLINIAIYSLKIVRTEALRVFKDFKPEEKDSSPSTFVFPSLHDAIYDIFDEFTSIAIAKAFWKRLLAVGGEPTLLAAVSSKLSSVVLDVLVVQETEADEICNTTRQSFLKELMQVGLKEALVKQVDIVWRFSIASAAAILNIPEPNLSRSYRVSVSKHFYTLPEFNLFREESEGYSKLISFLLTTDLDAQPQQFTSNITEMIGAYSLHPNRVLDIVISSTGYHLDRFFSLPISRRSFESYSITIAPLLEYISAQPRSHIYSLLSFHLRTQPWVKSSTTPIKTQTTADASKTNPLETNSTPIETVNGLALSTCRILAMLIKFEIFDLTSISALILPSNASSINSIAKSIPDKLELMDDGNAIPETTPKSLEEKFSSNPQLQLLLALLEIPTDKPLAFLSDDSDISQLFIDHLQPEIFRLKRVAAVFSQNIVSHLNSIYLPFSPSNRLNPNHNMDKVPDMSSMIEVMLEIKDLLRMMGENISSPLHHILCVILAHLVDGLLHSGHVSSELGPSKTDGNDETSNPSKIEILPGNINNVPVSTLSTLFGAIEEIVTYVILPSFVCLDINGDCMWQLLQKFPFEWRYRVYHSWGKMMRTSSFPQLSSVATEARLKVKGMMKRMTDTSIKETGRPLCKFGNRFPIVLADLIGSLIFPNFVQPLAESMRYLSDVSLDVLIYSCLDAALNMPTNSAYQHFANVASFVASVYKLYYERLDIVPLLDVIEQLIKRSKLTGATLFTTLLSKMGCVDILEETASSQLKMVNSFPSLHTLGISGALQSKETSRSSIVPLRDRLWGSNSWLPLYILTLQLENYCAFHSETNDITTISNSFDTVHQLSLQIAEFTSHIFKKYSAQVNPSLLLSAGQIAQEYQVPFASILHLYRPILHLIYTDVAELFGNTNPFIAHYTSSSSSSSQTKSIDNDLSKDFKQPSKTNKIETSEDRLLLLSDDLDFSRKNNGKTIVHFPLQERIQKTLDSMMPPPDPNAEYFVHKTDLSPIKDYFPMNGKFLAAFWGLRLIDVECNVSIYKQAMVGQTQLHQQGHSSTYHGRDKSFDISAATLEKELSAHSEHVTAVFDRLKQQSSSEDWFVDRIISPHSSSSSSNGMDVDQNSEISESLASLDEDSKKKSLAMSFLQHCIFPRAMMSADDALYCGAFIRMLHKLNPSPLWDTEVFFDVFFSIAPLMFSSTTTNESSRYGRLVCSMVETFVAWRDFDTWCADLGGRDYTSQESFSTSTTTPLNNSSSATANVNQNGMDVDIASSFGQIDPSIVDMMPNIDNQSNKEVDGMVAVSSIKSSTSSSVASPHQNSSSTDSPLRLAHREYCLKSIHWEKTLLDHVLEGIARPLDRWMRRAILFSLKELSNVFPTSERFCSILSHCLKTHAAGSEDLKALTNSYQNLLELRAKSVLPHKQFEAIFPGFIFPDAPVIEKPVSQVQVQMMAAAVTTITPTIKKPVSTPTPPNVINNTNASLNETLSNKPRGRGHVARSTTPTTGKDESTVSVASKSEDHHHPSTSNSSTSTPVVGSSETPSHRGGDQRRDFRDRGPIGGGGGIDGPRGGDQRRDFRDRGPIGGGGIDGPRGDDRYHPRDNYHHSDRRDFRDRDRDGRDFRDRRDRDHGGDWNRGSDSRGPQKDGPSLPSSSSNPVPVTANTPSSSSSSSSSSSVTFSSNDASNTKKRGRSGESNDLPPPEIEKRQKISEVSSKATPVATSTTNSPSPSNQPSDTKPKDETFGPPLPPSKGHGGGRKYDRFQRKR
jgi:hypothetical protein